MPRKPPSSGRGRTPNRRDERPGDAPRTTGAKPRGKPGAKPGPTPGGKPARPTGAKPGAKPSAKPGAKPSAKPAPKPTVKAAPLVDVEVACLPGLVEVLQAEVRARLGEGGALDAAPPKRRGPVGREDALALSVTEHGRAALHELRTAVAVERVRRFAVPRPKALLGDAVLRELQGELQAVVAAATAARAPFTALRLEAAGRESPVMRRLAEALAAGVGLPEDPNDGDLRVRVRPDDGGWAVLVRTTRRPLSARGWRVCDRPGGLNASLAAAVPWLARPGRGVHALNAFAGSGTLAIELALADPDARVDGVDLDPEAVACAERNASAAGVEGRVRFAVGDATALGAADASVRLLLADPPWGDAVGAHVANRALYPAFLAEAARVVAPGGRFALVTHEVALVHELLAGDAGAAWRPVHERRVWHGGHHPLLLVVERVPGGGGEGRRRSGGGREPRSERVLT